MEQKASLLDSNSDVCICVDGNLMLCSLSMFRCIQIKRQFKVQSSKEILRLPGTRLETAGPTGPVCILKVSTGTHNN